MRCQVTSLLLQGLLEWLDVMLGSPESQKENRKKFDKFWKGWHPILDRNLKKRIESLLQKYGVS